MMEIKQCCADFYEDDKVRLIFGDSLHPGGLDLTKELGQKLSIKKGSKVLDVASGVGTSASLFAINFGAQVKGIDLSEKNIKEARKKAEKENVTNVEFKIGDAEKIDFEDGTFDFVISECSFCLFPDKQKASNEMYRVLKAKGKLGMSDVIIRGKIPDKMKSILYKFICIQDAKSEQEYKKILENSGFKNFSIEDKKDEVINLLEDIRKRIFVFEIAKNLKKIELDLDLDNIKENIKEIRDYVDKDLISYALMTAEKTT